MSNRDFTRQAIASRLRSARVLAGLTQAQVARALGLHRPTVSEMEAGRRKVSVEEMSRLAELYGVNIPWVVGEDENQASPVMDRVTLAARELSKLRGEDLDRLLQLIRSLRTTESGG